MTAQLLELIFFYVPQALNCFFDRGEFLEEKKGTMTVQEAGRRGGLKTSETHGELFYSEIVRKGGKIGGPKGGQRVRNLILEGKEHEQE
jgi:uncharacterized protein